MPFDTTIRGKKSPRDVPMTPELYEKIRHRALWSANGELKEGELEVIIRDHCRPITGPKIPLQVSP